ncbi:hypothetical protein ACO0SA_003617 [Hanseniaspora valbyensis]
MDKLLQWSTKIANGEDVDMSSLTYEQQIMLKQLLLKDQNSQTYDEPTLMKLNMKIMAMTLQKGVSSDEEFQNRIQASENFLFLIENIDNSSVLAHMKLIDEILVILKNFGTEFKYENYEFLANILEIVGSSCQNNEPLQNDFMKFVTTDEEDKKVNVSDLIIEIVVNLLKQVNGNSTNKNDVELIISKSFYALSNLIRHHAKWGKLFFENENSLNMIKTTFSLTEQLNSSVKLKLVSLLQSLLSVSSNNDAACLKFWQNLNIIESISNFIEFNEHNKKIYLIDNSILIIHRLLENNIVSSISSETKQQLISKLDTLKNDKNCWERLNQEDFNTLYKSLA